MTEQYFCAAVVLSLRMVQWLQPFVLRIERFAKSFAVHTIDTSFQGSVVRRRYNTRIAGELQ